eukprot:12554751-Heterocapsa_arctica.AAC.1
MIENTIEVQWDARSETPRERQPKQIRAPTEVEAQAGPERPEGQDPGVQSDAAAGAAGDGAVAQKAAARDTAAGSAVTRASS